MGKYAGMTTLDRLEAAGLIVEFERAVAVGARKKAIDMLISVELSEAQAAAVYEGAQQIRRNYGLGGS